MEIRQIAAGDSIAELTRLLHAAYARLGQLGFNYTAVDQSEEVTRERLAGGTCFVAVEHGAVVGTIMLYEVGKSRGTPWYERAYVAAIGQFGVSPGRQGAGIGRGLMRICEEVAAANGAVELALDTAEGAVHLVDWYGRMGFRVVEHVQWTGKRYRSVIMSKPLAVLGERRA